MATLLCLLLSSTEETVEVEVGSTPEPSFDPVEAQMNQIFGIDGDEGRPGAQGCTGM